MGRGAPTWGTGSYTASPAHLCCAPTQDLAFKKRIRTDVRCAGQCCLFTCALSVCLFHWLNLQWCSRAAGFRLILRIGVNGPGTNGWGQAAFLCGVMCAVKRVSAFRASLRRFGWGQSTRKSSYRKEGGKKLSTYFPQNKIGCYINFGSSRM